VSVSIYITCGIAIRTFILSIVDDVRKAVREDGYRPFSRIMEMTHFLSGLIANTTCMPRITWNDNVGEGMVFDGHLITTTSFRIMYQKLLSDTKKTLFDKVLLGLELPDLRHDHIHDELSNSEPGYSFISDTRNNFRDHRHFLIRSMLEDEKHRDHFYNYQHTNEGSGVAWKAAAIIEWMKTCENCIGNLFALAHYGSGQPARGTELSIFAPENTTIQLRSIYSYGGFINLVSMYNKTQTNTQRSRVIGRSLPPPVGELFVYWLALVLPTLDMIWTTWRTLPDDPARFRLRIFTGLTGNFDTNDFSTILSSLSGERVVDGGMGHAMGVADTRHYLISVMRKYCRGIRNRSFLEEYFNEQSGHKEDAAENYAITTSSILSVSEDHLDKFIEISKLQHLLLFPDTLHEDAKSRSTGISEIAKIDYNKLSEMIITQLPSQLLPPFASQVANLLAPSMKRNIVDAIATVSPITPQAQSATMAVASGYEMQSLLSSITSDIGAAAGEPMLVDTSQIEISPARWSELRQIMGSNAVFKSSHQACAVELSARRDKDLLVILGTGGGKSLIFTLCAANATEKDLTTIVIVPLLALIQDLAMHLRAKRIRVTKWDKNVGHYGGQVTILSTDSAASAEFLTYFLTGCQKKKIARVVLDEIHTLITENHYRPLFDRIPQLRQGNVPFIGLSATIPPSAVPKIMAKMHFFPQNTFMIRAPTVRREIAYSAFEIISQWGYKPVDALYRGADGKSLKIIDYVTEIIGKFQPNERALIFCLSRNDAEEFAMALGCKYYHAGINVEDKTSIVDSWRDGTDSKALVATTALGAGIHYAEVKLVVNYKKPRNIINFSQESGRGGRELEVALSTVFWDPKQPDWSLADNQDNIGVEGMTDYVTSCSCRRFCLGKCLGDRTYRTCLQDATVALCDLCERRVKEAPVVSEQF
jgi:superfamily II DNA helicase RecQ